MKNIVVSSNIQFRDDFKSEYVEFFKVCKQNYVIQVGGSVSGVNIFLSSPDEAREFVKKILNDIEMVEAEEAIREEIKVGS